MFAIDWYKESTEVLSKYQSESMTEEEEKQAKEKKELLKELESELKELKVKS